MTLDELKKAAEAATGWRNCTDAWETIDESGYKTATIGHISEDDEKYPVIEVDCAQYFADDESIVVAKFIALANPATILAMLKVVEAARASCSINFSGGYVAIRDALKDLDK